MSFHEGDALEFFFWTCAFMVLLVVSSIFVRSLFMHLWYCFGFFRLCLLSIKSCNFTDFFAVPEISCLLILLLFLKFCNLTDFSAAPEISHGLWRETYMPNINNSSSYWFLCSARNLNSSSSSFFFFWNYSILLIPSPDQKSRMDHEDWRETYMPKINNSSSYRNFSRDPMSQNGQFE